MSMGSKMKNFEAPVDPLTGTVRIDHTFEPNIVSPEENDHMPGQHAFDPSDEEMKIQDCVTLHLACRQAPCTHACIYILQHRLLVGNSFLSLFLFKTIMAGFLTRPAASGRP